MLNPSQITEAQPRPRSADPCVLVIFGAAGDLTKRLLVPALENLQQAGLLPKEFAVIGVARRDMDDEAFRREVGVREEQGKSSEGERAWLAERFEGLDDDVATRKLIAAAVAAEQVLDLVDRGVTDFHFYTMNRADLVYAICHLLGLRPAVKEAA